MARSSKSHTAHQTFVALITAGALCASSLLAAELAVGSKTVDGTRIRPYEASWTQRMKQDDVWQDGPTLTERATVRKDGNRQLLEHVQTMKAPGREVVNTMTFDHTSLEPLELHQSMAGGPPSAPTAVQFAFEKNAIKAKATTADGPQTFEVETPSPMFYGMTFGLVLAALPLEKGFTAELPASMPQYRSKFNVKIDVVGTETYTANGRTFDAWIVNTEWIDLDSGDVSPGGATKSGGAYHVVTDPPAGFPYVPMYVNDTMQIAVIP